MINKNKMITGLVLASTIFASGLSFAKPLLWGSSVSPYVRKVQVVMEEKGINYDQKEILPKLLNDLTKTETPKEFLEASFLGKIPAFENNNDKMSDSAVIIAYLEKKFPRTKSMYPAKPAEYAKAVWFEHYADEVIGNANKKVFFEKFVKPNVLKSAPDMKLVNEGLNVDLPKIQSYLNKEVGKNKYLVANKFTVADVAVATHFISLKQAGFEVDAKQYPNLAKYLDRIFKQTSFKNHL